METKVYVVTSGSYSDYKIERVFSNEAAADEYTRVRNEHGGDGFTVEEYGLDSAVPRVEIQYSVVIDSLGEELRRVTKAEVEPTPEEMVDEARVWSFSGQFNGRSFRGYDVALKIARDKLAEYKAQQAGV